VIVIDKGGIVFAGTPAEVFAHEKELEAIHLSVPFGYALASRLREKGIDVPPELHDIDALEDFLCR
ncbi:MAG: energy-coupling factor transporter ATPase, partial [Candidatus Enteromonas sp.]